MGHRCIADPIGWGGALFELEFEFDMWDVGCGILKYVTDYGIGIATYILLWPEYGRM